MRASILRWVLPIVVMLLIATVLVLSPLLLHLLPHQQIK